MLTNALQLGRQYPNQAEAILKMFNTHSDAKALRDLLGTCYCTSDTLACTCPPEYSQPKPADYSGHIPANN
jgi:hypothetical protein